MKDFVSTYDQIGRKQSIIWSYLREKSSMENFIFSVMSLSIVSMYDMVTFQRKNKLQNDIKKILESPPIVNRNGRQGKNEKISHFLLKQK